MTTGWFVGIMGIVNNVNMLAIVLTGAAVIREREHGTMDHLLMMPLRPYEIALAKIWANALVITAAAGLSLVLVTPLDSMPWPLRLVMEACPSTHLISSAQAILFRGAGFATVWPDFLVSAGVGLLFLLLALRRFRQVSAVAI